MTLEVANFLQIMLFGLGKALKSRKTQWSRTYMVASEDIMVFKEDLLIDSILKFNYVYLFYQEISRDFTPIQIFVSKNFGNVKN